MDTVLGISGPASAQQSFGPTMISCAIPQSRFELVPSNSTAKIQFFGRWLFVATWLDGNPKLLSFHPPTLARLPASEVDESSLGHKESAAQVSPG